MSKAFLRDLLLYSPSRILPPIMGIVLLPILTRLLAPSEFGVYTLFLTSITFLLSLSAWIRVSIIRFYAQFRIADKLERFHRAIIQYCTVTTAGLSGLVLGGYFLLPRDMCRIGGVLLALAIMAFGLSSFSGVLQALLRVQSRIRLFSVAAMWFAVMPPLTGVLCALWFDGGITALFLGRVLAMAVAVPVLWRLCLGGVRVLMPCTSDGLLRTMSSYGIPIVVSSLAACFLRLSDRYLIAFFLGNHEVGLYSVSYGIAERSVAVIVSLFLLADRPVAMELWEKSQADEEKVRVRAFLSDTTRLFLLVSVPACFGVCAMAEKIVLLLSTSDYAAGHRIVPFVVCGLFLGGLANRYQLPILFHKRTEFIMINTLIAATLNVVLNLIFIPRYGYYAAAVTTLISYISYFTVTVWFSRRLLEWVFPVKSLIRSGFCSAVMYMAVRLLLGFTEFGAVAEVVVGLTSGVAVYALLLWGLGEVSSRERQELVRVAKSALRRKRRGRP